MAAACTTFEAFRRVDTATIESMIGRATDNDQAAGDLTDLLAAVAERRGLEPGPAQLARGAGFVLAYIELVPYMMKVAFTAAHNVGLERDMQWILDMAHSYWIEDDDVIPDELGVIGVLDDAYCSLTSLQMASDQYRLLTGNHLFPDDLTAANEAMREIIGEPYVTELDRIVVRTLKETGLMESVKNLAEDKKRINLDSESTIWSHGPVSRITVEDLSGLGITDD
jgi:uncharacterized membrane protein YkvA (DUF1232 family)